jgi:fatty acid desaturase
VFEAFCVALAIGYYVWGGRDTDVGAVMGHRADERQASLQMKVAALQGKVMTVVAGLVLVIATVGKATVWPKAAVWPFTIPVIVAGLSGLAGWAIYRDHDNGDDADGAAAERTEPRVPIRPGSLSRRGPRAAVAG